MNVLCILPVQPHNSYSVVTKTAQSFNCVRYTLTPVIDQVYCSILDTDSLAISIEIALVSDKWVGNYSTGLVK